MEELHKKIETYIVDNLSTGSLKYSLVRDNARDISLPSSPLLIEGSDNFVVLTVDINTVTSAAIGNKAKRFSGNVIAEIYVSNDSTDRETYKILSNLSAFLERQSFEGIIFRDTIKAGRYKVGQWVVTTFTFDFSTTNTVI